VRTCRRAWCAAAAALALAGAASADAGTEEAGGATSRLRVNGYGTLGYHSTHSDQPWIFKRDLAQPVDAEHGRDFVPDTSLGLQATWQANERLSAVGQVVLRRRADSAAAQESLEWAFVSYRVQPELTVRVGRTSPDLFLLADHRNVGFAYPWVRPSVEFYGWFPLYSVDGVDIAKSWQQGSVRWEAKGLFGANNRITVPMTGGFQDAKFRGTDGYAFTLSREEGGLTVKLSLSGAKARFTMDPQVQAGLDALRSLTALPVPAVAREAQALNASVPFSGFGTRYAGIGAGWEHGPWMLQGELARVTSDFKTLAGTLGYFSTAYRIGSVTLFGTLSQVRPSHDAASNPNWMTQLVGAGVPLPQALEAQVLGSAAAAAINSMRMDQRSVAAGMRWDMTPQLALKLQWDRFQVRANGSGLWGNGTASPGRADVYSASLNFVF
jgi:hypothetical protein